MQAFFKLLIKLKTRMPYLKVYKDASPCASSYLKVDRILETVLLCIR